MAKAITEKKKEYKLDLFKEVLPALYRGDLGFYDRQSDEGKKSISPFMLLRWMSLDASNGHDAVGIIQSEVNNNFWSLNKHPELQWKLLATIAVVIGSGRMPRFEKWMMPKLRNSTKTPVIDSLLLKLYPLVNEEELNYLRGKYTTAEEVKEFAEQFGASDSELKDVLKEFKETNG